MRIRRCSGLSTRNRPPKDQNAWPPKEASGSWSSSRTRRPASASSAVATRPASPAPTTITSASVIGAASYATDGPSAALGRLRGCVGARAAAAGALGLVEQRVRAALQLGGGFAVPDGDAGRAADDAGARGAQVLRERERPLGRPARRQQAE